MGKSSPSADPSPKALESPGEAQGWPQTHSGCPAKERTGPALSWGHWDSAGLGIIRGKSPSIPYKGWLWGQSDPWAWPGLGAAHTHGTTALVRLEKLSEPTQHCPGHPCPLCVPKCHLHGAVTPQGWALPTAHPHLVPLARGSFGHSSLHSQLSSLWESPSALQEEDFP